MNYCISRLNDENGRQGVTLFSGLGRHNLDLVVDYCVANACAPSYVLHRAGSSSTEGFAMKQLKSIKYMTSTRQCMHVLV